MEDRIFHKRLQGQLDDPVAVQLLRHPVAEGECLHIAHRLDLHIIVQQGRFFFQCDLILRALCNVFQQVGQAAGHAFNARAFLDHCHPTDGIQCIIKEVGVHLTLQQLDLDFSTCLDSWGYAALAIPVKGEHRFTESADYVSGAHLGYLKQGLLPMRKLVFLKELNVLLVFDQLFGEGKHTFEQNFHFGEGDVTLEGSTVYWKGQRACAALQCLGSDAQLRLHKAPYSREYNTLLESSALTVQRTAEHFNWFVTALHLMPDACPAPMHAELLPVSKLRAGVPLTDVQAQAVRVTVGGKNCVVLLCHSEVISEVDLLSAGGYSGYGKVLIFDPAHPHGLCLAW